MVVERRFSWKKLPAGLRASLAELAGVKASSNDAVWLAKLGDQPGAEWLAENWLWLRDDWLWSDLPNARTLSKALIERGMGRPERYGRSREDVNAYLSSCRSSPTLVEELDELFWNLGGVRVKARANPAEKAETPVLEAAADAEGYVGLRRWVPPPGVVDEWFRPYQHQGEAWAALDTAYKNARAAHPKKGLRGLLVLPTGGGKTATAVRWLCSNVLQPGATRPVLWVAHRAELLEQAALAFGHHVDATGRTRENPLDVQSLSSRHGRGVERLADSEIEVTCASMMTLVAGDNELVVERFLQDHPDTFIVIDEAHHAGARSYRWLLSLADKYRGVDVLGLTATPTRTAERERGWIATLFPDGIIYEADLSTLISRGVLARPHMHDVDTGETFELTPKERAHLQQFSDYSPETLQRLANSISRNNAIVEHYVSRQAQYGQTLVFATNVAHAMSLAEHFRSVGVTADYVTYVAEPGHRPTHEVLKAFSNGEIKVLTSVTKLTEGVDLPKVETVFLARPTRSEILLKQMIGRALRGPEANGTEHAHMVSFADHWEDFADWLDPRTLFPPEDIVDEDAPPAPPTELVEVPWELYRELARQIRQVDLGGAIDLVPAGWYDLAAFEGEQDDLPLRQVAVFDHQRDGLEALLDDAVDGRLSQEPLADYFTGVPAPLPTEQACSALQTYVRELEQRPPFVMFEQRDDYLPKLVAERYVQRLQGSDIDYAGHIWDTTHASVVYPDRGTYIRTVRRYVEDLTLDGGGLDEWVPVDLTSELRQPLAPGSWNLNELCDEVHAEMGLEKPAPPIGWSSRRLRSYWGFYTGEPAAITVNIILQTDSISRDALKFLIYHELLHHELGVHIGHRGEFRSRERQYSEWHKLSAELDGLADYFVVESSPRTGRSSADAGDKIARSSG